MLIYEVNYEWCDDWFVFLWCVYEHVSTPKLHWYNDIIGYYLKLLSIYSNKSKPHNHHHLILLLYDWRRSLSNAVCPFFTTISPCVFNQSKDFLVEERSELVADQKTNSAAEKRSRAIRKHIRTSETPSSSCITQRKAFLDIHTFFKSNKLPETTTYQQNIWNSSNVEHNQYSVIGPKEYSHRLIKVKLYVGSSFPVFLFNLCDVNRQTIEKCQRVSISNQSESQRKYIGKTNDKVKTRYTTSISNSDSHKGYTLGDDAVDTAQCGTTEVKTARSWSAEVWKRASASWRTFPTRPRPPERFQQNMWRNPPQTLETDTWSAFLSLVHYHHYSMGKIQWQPTTEHRHHTRATSFRLTVLTSWRTSAPLPHWRRGESDRWTGDGTLQAIEWSCEQESRHW